MSRVFLSFIFSSLLLLLSGCTGERPWSAGQASMGAKKPKLLSMAFMKKAYGPKDSLAVLKITLSNPLSLASEQALHLEVSGNTALLAGQFTSEGDLKQFRAVFKKGESTGLATFPLSGQLSQSGEEPLKVSFSAEAKAQVDSNGQNSAAQFFVSECAEPSDPLSAPFHKKIVSSEGLSSNQIGFLICEKEELRAIQEFLNNNPSLALKYVFRQGQDIDLENSSTNLTVFSQIYDGGGYSVEHIYREALKNSLGFVAVNKGVIQNLTVKNSIFKNALNANSTAGAISGYNQNQIQNCTSENNEIEADFAGGISGVNWSNFAQTGIVAQISDSFSRKNQITGAVSAGGAVGNNGHQILRCLAENNLVKSLNAQGFNGVTSLLPSAGGFVGTNNQLISDSFALDSQVFGLYAGPFFGRSTGTIMNSDAKNVLVFASAP